MTAAYILTNLKRRSVNHFLSVVILIRAGRGSNWWRHVIWSRTRSIDTPFQTTTFRRRFKALVHDVYWRYSSSAENRIALSIKQRPLQHRCAPDLEGVSTKARACPHVIWLCHTNGLEWLNMAVLLSLLLNFSNTCLKLKKECTPSPNSSRGLCFLWRPLFPFTTGLCTSLRDSCSAASCS